MPKFGESRGINDIFKPLKITSNKFIKINRITFFALERTKHKDIRVHSFSK